MNPNHANRSLRTLTFCALLVAMSIVFSRVLSISTGFLRFNLGSLPVVLAGAEFVLVRVLLANHALMEAARGGRTGRRS